MQHLDNAAVTGDQYAVLQFKGPVCRYAGHSLVGGGQTGAGLRGQTCLVVTGPVLSGHWSGHTSRSVLSIQYYMYMLGLGDQVEILKAPNCVASQFYLLCLGAHLTLWLNIALIFPCT